MNNNDFETLFQKMLDITNDAESKTLEREFYNADSIEERFLEYADENGSLDIYELPVLFFSEIRHYGAIYSAALLARLIELGYIAVPKNEQDLEHQD